MVHLACGYRPTKRTNAIVNKTDQAKHDNGEAAPDDVEAGALQAESRAGGFDARERDEFAFVEDDGLGAAQKFPPFPGAAGGDQEKRATKANATKASKRQMAA